MFIQCAQNIISRAYIFSFIERFIFHMKYFSYEQIPGAMSRGAQIVNNILFYFNLTRRLASLFFDATATK